MVGRLGYRASSVPCQTLIEPPSECQIVELPCAAVCQTSRIIGRFRDSGIERQTATFDGVCRILSSARRCDVAPNEVRVSRPQLVRPRLSFPSSASFRKSRGPWQGGYCPTQGSLAVILRVPRVESRSFSLTHKRVSR